jgi:hypothetical protein
LPYRQPFHECASREVTIEDSGRYADQKPAEGFGQFDSLTDPYDAEFLEFTESTKLVTEDI